jgi:hypothetical protein
MYVKLEMGLARSSRAGSARATSRVSSLAGSASTARKTLRQKMARARTKMSLEFMLPNSLTGSERAEKGLVSQRRSSCNSGEEGEGKVEEEGGEGKGKDLREGEEKEVR